VLIRVIELTEATFRCVTAYRSFLYKKHCLAHTFVSQRKMYTYINMWLPLVSMRTYSNPQSLGCYGEKGGTKVERA
jgi:hypothetical protein